jgi:hypothetical protein
MKCPTCRKGWIDIDVAGEVEHDLCHDCGGTGVVSMTASPIRDASGKLAITPGNWKDYGERIHSGGHGAVATVRYYYEANPDAKANAALIAEAGTVTNATNRTPAELAALVRELREAIEMYIECSELKYLTRTLAKSEGV